MLLDLIFPKRCYHCGKTGSYLCRDCFEEIPLLKKQKCPRCGKPSPGGRIHPIRNTRYAKLYGLVRLYSYKSVVGRMVRHYKYEQVRKLKSRLVDLTAGAIRRHPKHKSYWLKKEFTFIPIPLFPLKKLVRGFDQADEIISQVSEKLQIGYSSEILIRQKWTSQQAGKSKDKRQKNVKNAFAVESESVVKDKNFIIFDDVTSTGSTLKSAASALKSAGAGELWGLTICG